MPTFEQLPGEPADSFAQLLVHRDAGPARLYRDTAVATGSSISTLRRRAERWDWQTRLDVYDAEILKTMESQSTADVLHRHEKHLREFRDLQLDRSRRLGQLADELMKRGVPAKKGGSRWYPANVSHILLRNRSS